MKRIIISLVFLFIFVFSSFAQRPEELEETIRKEEERFLLELKKHHPELYEEELKRIEERKKREEIISLYRQKKITKEEALMRLRPFVEKEIDIKRYTEGIDEEIKMLEEEIRRLKEIKKNPQLLIEEEMERWLR